MTDVVFEWQKASPSEQGNYFEFIIEAVIRSVVNTEDVVIDVGANYGAHSVTMLERVGEAGKVVAFEPNPDVFRTLQLLGKKFANYHPFPVALSDYTGTTELSVSANGEGYGSISGRDDLPSVRSYAVEVCRLDDIAEVAGTSAIPLIKVDVEGEEVRFLRGAMATLARARPLVLIEISWAHVFERSGESLVEFFAMLDKIGYKVFDFQGERVTTMRPECWNVFLVPDQHYFDAKIRNKLPVLGLDFFANHRDWDPYQKLK